jgi:hypothetical protein
MQRATIAQAHPEWVGQLLERLDKVDAMLGQLLHQRTAKEWYSTEEVAQLFGKAKFTVREWCRKGRVNCRKRANGRGKHQSWVISHEEVLRIQREGLFRRTQHTSS